MQRGGLARAAVIARSRPARFAGWAVAAILALAAAADVTLRGLEIGARSRPARFAGWAVAAILALAAAAAYAVALWKAPGWMHATGSQARYNARVLVISVGGAVVVGTGLLYTARNYRLSRR